MRNAQNLQLAQLQAFPANNMLQLAQLQQPLRPQRLGGFLPPFTAPLLPSPMMAGGLTSAAAMYPNVAAFPNIFAQPHCHHYQHPQAPCHHHSSDDYFNCRGRRGCSGSHGHSSLESPFNRGSYSRSHSRSHSRTRRRSRSRSPSFRNSRVEIITGARGSHDSYSRFGRTLCIPLEQPWGYQNGLNRHIMIPLSASIRDIWDCLEDFVGSRRKSYVDVRMRNGSVISLNDFRSVDDLRAREDMIVSFFLY